MDSMEASCSSLNWKRDSNLPMPQFSNCLDEMPKVQRSRRYYAFQVDHSSNLVLFTGILFLLSATVYLDRTLDDTLGWNIDRRWRLADARVEDTSQADSVSARSERILNSLNDRRETGTQAPVPIHGSGARGALRGLGVTFRKGSRPMTELVIAHIEETTPPELFKLFIRTLHRSGVTARADVVFLLPSKPSKDVTNFMEEEERSFWQLMTEKQSIAPPHRISKPSKKMSKSLGLMTANSSILSPFNLPAFWQSREEGIRGKGRREVIWQVENVSTHDSTLGNAFEEQMAVVDWGDWGSIVLFDMQDLDQDEALQAFIGSSTAQLRRWVCYKMLLGMLKPKYKNVLLTEVGGVIILGDILSSTRAKSFGSRIFLFMEDQTWNERHLSREKFSRECKSPTAAERPGESLLVSGGQKYAELVFSESTKAGNYVGNRSNGRQDLVSIQEIYGTEVWKKLEEDDKQKPMIGSGVIMGGLKNVLVLSNAMLTEIVRVAAIVRKSQEPFHDQALLNYLVLKSAILKTKVAQKLQMCPNGASCVHSLPGTKQKSIFGRDSTCGRFHALQGLKHELVGKQKAKFIVDRIHEDICSLQESSKIYEDCSRTLNRKY